MFVKKFPELSAWWLFLDAYSYVSNKEKTKDNIEDFGKYSFVLIV